ncbi:phosphoribosylaminoimidazolesuccinocarboxamide synthase [Vagococcus xieshaowenii]|uniref:Phosphoribosylaminoimidazole-succinocarboxamide synthase n=1 Tax=Vagococcus xieshaowenii TaxID=2562451 RepID=A0AAJ5EFW8_9ENTE|nr:phosphoribosylaminoimidazolesuccinocarboxamide synthase [Vagococcus xieshaowenii]QCA28808.1 phosphoribosylaminoimidazolesuccinocarboxamide synthase [Vagococcus xieshaowenii]TFZ42991.1 phosphoribosylaminoimidazolesuccinocarboxamide synthase [Vagococcus xieshaowenii]
MKRNGLIYAGKAKKLFLTDDEQVLWVEYLDQATALNGLKKDKVIGKGQLNNKITSRIFDYLTEQGIDHHFIQQKSPTEQIIQRLQIIPLEVVVRNVVAGSFAKRFGLEEGQELEQPIVEFYFKNDALDDPFINDEHVLFLEIASKEEIAELKQLALEINHVLRQLFDQLSILLVDFKLEFGRNSQGKITLGDEISPDTCRLWDKETSRHLDKDVYRRNIGEIVSVYEEVLDRLEQLKGGK